MKPIIRRKLQNLADQMLKRLFDRAKELKLQKKDIFLLTSIGMIKSHLRTYDLGLSIGEDLPLKSFVTQCQRVIDSLVISIEDPLSI